MLSKAALNWIKRKQPTTVQARLALMLTVPASTLGVFISTVIAPGSVGQGIFTLLKVWLVLLPLVWATRIDGDRLRLPRLTRQDILAGLGLGLIMFAAITGAYGLFGPQWIDFNDIRAKAAQVGLTSPVVFLVGAAYWTFINAFIEEAVWRNFIYRKCEVLVPRISAVLLAAFFFTLHHSLALWFYTQDWRVVVLGSLGVFLAGVSWSICYSLSRSLWPGYLSHILADAAIALVGYHLLFS